MSREREKELEQNERHEMNHHMDKELLLDFKTLWQNGDQKEKMLLVNSVFEQIIIDMQANNKRMQRPLVRKIVDVDVNGVEFESF